MSHFFWIPHLVVLDLVEIDALREFICLAEGDHRHFVLTGHVSDHRCAHLRHDAAVAQYVARADEYFSCSYDECTDPLDQRVNAFDAQCAESLDEGTA